MKSIFSIETLRSEIQSTVDEKEKLKKIAGEFEAIFLEELLSELSSSTKNPFFSSATNFWQEMYYSQLAEEIAHKEGIGLKRYILKAFEKHMGGS
jgi:Rod binding domain-containing protein